MKEPIKILICARGGVGKHATITRLNGEGFKKNRPLQVGIDMIKGKSYNTHEKALTNPVYFWLPFAGHDTQLSLP